MANKSATSKNKTSKSALDVRADFVGYVNVTLTEEDRSDFESWSDDRDLLDTAYIEALADGYQFTTKFDKRGDVYMVSVSTWDRGKSDAGIIYTGRSDDPTIALAKSLFVLARKLNWDLANGYVKRGFQDAF